MREGLNGKAYPPWSESLTGMCRRGHILKETAPGAPVFYTYDDVGNITKINNEDYITCDAKKKTTTQSYSYDDLDRLTEASGSYSHETWLPYYTDRINSYTSSFSYDSIGNILNKNQKNVGTYTDGSTKTLTDTTYDWDYKYTSTRPHAVTQTGTLFYTYDASGNMTRKTDTNTNASTVFTWNEENRLTQTVATTTSTTDTATTTYKYDDTGTRIAKKGANGETIYVNTNYSIKDEQLESTHIFAGQTRIATKLTMLTTKTTTTDMGVYYYHPDHIGSASTVTDSSGKFTEHCEYFPYGEVWISESASTDTTSLLPFKFTGKELDPETGLYYYGARYMDPKLGRFVSTDAYLSRYLPSGNKEKDNNLPGMGGVLNPINLNTYHYAGDNPVIYVDPDGQAYMYRFNDSGQLVREYVQNPTVHKIDQCGDSLLRDASQSQAKGDFSSAFSQRVGGVFAKVTARLLNMVDNDGPMAITGSAAALEGTLSTAKALYTSDKLMRIGGFTAIVEIVGAFIDNSGNPSEVANSKVGTHLSIC